MTRPEQTLDFAYRDDRLLVPGQQRSGRVWIPPLRASTTALPLVVVLHGIDKTGARRVHRLLDGPTDLRPVVRRLLAQRRTQPVLLAAPSQTRDAKGASTLWTPKRFDLASFLRAVERRLATTGVRVDRGQISVVGHSGAGCYLAGDRGNGLFRVVGDRAALRSQGYVLRWVGFMDTCLLGAYGAHWLRRALRGTETRAAVMWTGPVEWSRRRYRKPQEFSRVLAPQRVRCDRSRYASCRESARGDWVFAARRNVLRHVFGDRSGRAQPVAPHWGLTRWFLQRLLTRWLPGDGQVRGRV